MTNAVTGIMQSWPAARAWRKWAPVVAGMFFQDGMVYKANTLVWIMTDVVTAVTMPLIWLASYNGRAMIHGYTPTQMVVYYLTVLALTGLIESHVMWDMATDVKQGKFNNYLIRPYPMLEYMFTANLGWRLMRTLLSLPLLVLVALAFHHYLPHSSSVAQYHWGPAFWLAVVLGHMISFLLSYGLGLLSLWLYESRSIYELYYLLMLIFSGQIAPLTLLPPFLLNVIAWLPFPYVISFPVQIFLGRVSLTGAMARLRRANVLDRCRRGVPPRSYFWRGGVRRFTAFGI